MGQFDKVLHIHKSVKPLTQAMYSLHPEISMYLFAIHSSFFLPPPTVFWHLQISFVTTDQFAFQRIHPSQNHKYVIYFYKLIQHNYFTFYSYCCKYSEFMPSCSLVVLHFIDVHTLYIHSLIDGHSCTFHFLSISNKTAKMGV